MEITGNIIAVLPAQSGVSQRTGNAWMRQEYVIEVPGMYPKRMCFGLFGEDRIKQFALRQGEQRVTVQFDIDAHEHEGRWYNEIRAWNVIRAGQQPAPQPAGGAVAGAGAQPGLSGGSQPFPPAPAAGAAGIAAPGSTAGDDLPF